MQAVNNYPLRKARPLKLHRVLIHLFLAVTSFLTVSPLIWAVLTSFKIPAEIVTKTPSILPQTWTLANYGKLGDTAPFFQFFINSMIVAVVSTLFIIIGCTTAGYVFAKYQFRGKNFLFFLVIATILIPLQAYIIPLYIGVKAISWTNSYPGLILPTVVMSSGIFFLRQSIKSIPDELIDAARVDGANEFVVLFRIIFPLALSAIAAIAIVNWVFTWSQFLWPLIVASKEGMYTMEVGLSYFQRAFITDYGGVMAAAVVTILPVLVVFLFFRRQIIEGVATTGIK
jgi:ABC-type glycerol-3-phosphate transport system permease component